MELLGKGGETYLQVKIEVEPDVEAVTREEFELKVLEIETDLEAKIGKVIRNAAKDGLVKNGELVKATFWVDEEEVPDNQKESK